MFTYNTYNIYIYNFLNIVHNNKQFLLPSKTILQIDPCIAIYFRYSNPVISSRLRNAAQ